jgi:putative transposase
MDNVFIERLWRSLNGHLLERLLGRSRSAQRHRGMVCLLQYRARPHQALGNRTPMAVWREGTTGPLGEKAVDIGQGKSVAHMPTAAATTASLRYGRMIEAETETARIQSRRPLTWSY